MLATTDPDQQEPDYDPNERRPVLRLVKRTGVRASERWVWVEDPTETETGPERHARLSADVRLVDMHGMSVITGRSYATIKDIRHGSDAQREIAANARQQLNPGLADLYERISEAMLSFPVHSKEWEKAERDLVDIDQQIIAEAETHARKLTGPSGDEITQAVFRLREALLKLLTALPRQRDEQGQSPLWSVGDAVRWRRRSKKNNIWGEIAETRGRPKGSSGRVTE